MAFFWCFHKRGQLIYPSALSSGFNLVLDTARYSFCIFDGEHTMMKVLYLGEPILNSAFGIILKCADSLPMLNPCPSCLLKLKTLQAIRCCSSRKPASSSRKKKEVRNSTEKIHDQLQVACQPVLKPFCSSVCNLCVDFVQQQLRVECFRSSYLNQSCWETWTSTRIRGYNQRAHSWPPRGILSKSRWI